METLNDQERSFVQNAVGASSTVHSTSIARLYKSYGDGWEYSNVMGAASIITDGSGLSFLKIVDMKSKKITFEQQLYQSFEYNKPKPFFHTFEMDDCVAGLSFASESEANSFYTSVTKTASSVGSGGSGSFLGSDRASMIDYGSSSDYSQNNSGSGSFMRGPPTPSQRPTSTPVNTTMRPPPTPSSPPTRPYNSINNSTPPPSNSNSTVNLTSSSLRAGPPVVNNSFKPVNVESDQPVRLNKKDQKKADKEKKKNKGKTTSSSELVIGEPTNFRHESSIGWNSASGFEIRNIPAEWRKLFKEAGVKKSDLKDQETAGMIFNIINQQTGGTGMSRAPPPPPPGGMGGGGPPPPPPGSRPPPPPGQGRPPPGPPGGGGGGPPPPPPPPGGGGGRPPPPPGNFGGGGGGGPPPPPPPFGGGGGGGPPPPPPPPGNFGGGGGGPPPPPPPQPSYGNNSSNYDDGYGDSGGYDNYDEEPQQSSNPLQAALLKKQQNLKSSTSRTDIRQIEPEKPKGLAETLAAAMANRRGDMKEDVQDEEDEEWSDDDWD